MTGTAIPATTGRSDVTPVFLDDEHEVTVDTSGALAVLTHRTINALSSAGLALALVRAHASQRGDVDAVAACSEVAALIDRAARTARDRIVLRTESPAVDVLDIRAG